MAVGWEEEPLALYDATFWAFLLHSRKSLWVFVVSMSGRFSKAISERYGVVIPNPQTWQRGTLNTFVVWPKAEYGQTLYGSGDVS